MGIFSGSSVNCRWTVAKCDQKDTGGDAAYGVKGGMEFRQKVHSKILIHTIGLTVQAF